MLSLTSRHIYRDQSGFVVAEGWGEGAGNGYSISFGRWNDEMFSN
jgi:hypothetical protein